MNGPFIYFEIPILGGIPITQTAVSSFVVMVILCVAGILLAALRPFVRKFVSPRKTATNADMAIGRSAYLTETVDNLRGTGTLKLDGKEWTARSLSGDILHQGTLVTVVKMEGVKLYVEPAPATEP